MRDQSARQKFISFSLGTTAAVGALFILVVACSDQPARAKPNVITKEAPKVGVVGRIGGEEITEEMLVPKGDEKAFETLKQAFQIKMQVFTNLAKQKMLGAEAQKAGMTYDEYVDKKLGGDKVKVSDADYKKFLEQWGAKESDVPEGQRERIRMAIKSMKRDELATARLEKLTKNDPLEVYFKKPVPERKTVEVGKSPVKGKDNAPVTIVEFADFECVYCARALPTVKAVLKKYGDKVRLSFKHFPLSQIHPHAQGASEASLCVLEQGNDKFWKFYDIAFAHADKLDEVELAKYAKEAGANSSQYEECFKAKKYVGTIKEDQAYGEKLGVGATPNFFINGYPIAGAQPLEAFSEIIDDELAKAKK